MSRLYVLTYFDEKIGYQLVEAFKSREAADNEKNRRIRNLPYMISSFSIEEVIFNN